MESRGRDGFVRGARLRAGKWFLERAIRQLCPMELSCDKYDERGVPVLDPKAKYSLARLEKLNWPYFCLSISKNAICFLSSNILVFPRKTAFSISGPDIDLARLNWAENQPFSFDSHVAFIERRKVVIRLIYCITFPVQKSTITGKLDLLN